MHALHFITSQIDPIDLDPTDPDPTDPDPTDPGDGGKGGK